MIGEGWFKGPAHQVVRGIDPLIRFDGFEPRAADVRSLLPNVDRSSPVHNLASLADFGRASRGPAVDPSSLFGINLLMELSGQRVFPASVTTTWSALNDPEVLKSCIAGCESLVRTDENAMAAVVALEVGAVSARFRGNIAMTDVDAPNGCTINFEGQGGIAGFGKGSADVALSSQGPAQTLLSYNARVTVGGKMAQIGSRLIDATAAKITEDFFKAFEARLTAQAGEVPVAAVVAEVPPAPPAAAAPAPAPADASMVKLWWLIGGVVALAVLYFMIR